MDRQISCKGFIVRTACLYRNDYVILFRVVIRFINNFKFMKSYRNQTALFVATMALAFSFSVALAEDKIEVRATVQTGERSEQMMPATRTIKGDDQGDSREMMEKDSRVLMNAQASSTLRLKGDDRADVRASSTKKSEQGDDNEDTGDMGDRHERMMGRIFKDLNDIGDRSQGIGFEIREIARNEASSTEERVAAIHEIQRQNMLSRLIFGSDKNKLKNLSDELKTTDKSIERLNVARAKIASTTLQAKIDVQIQALQTARANAETFVKDNQDAFSIFGFFAKIFGGK